MLQKIKREVQHGPADVGRRTTPLRNRREAQGPARQRFPEAPGRRDPAYHFESLTFPVAEPKCEAFLATFHPVADGKARPTRMQEWR